MMKLLAGTLVLAASTAHAESRIAPDMLPKLIGSSAFVIEKEFGPTQGCSTGALSACGYVASGQQFTVLYREGIAVSVKLFLPKNSPRLTLAEIGFKDRCKSSSAPRADGAELWISCPGDFSVAFENLTKGGTFGVEVSASSARLR